MKILSMQTWNSYQKKYTQVIIFTLPQQNRSQQSKQTQAVKYSLFTDCSIDENENKHDFQSVGDFTGKFCANPKENATEIIIFEKKVNATADKKRKQDRTRNKNSVTYAKENLMKNKIMKKSMNSCVP